MSATAHRLITAAVPPDDQPEERPRRPGAFTPADLALVVGSLASSCAIVWLVYWQLLPKSDAGLAGFAVLWFVAFLATYWIVNRELHGAAMAADRVMAALMASAAIGLVVPLTAILVDVVVKGLHAFTLHVFTRTQQYTGPLAPASAGGAAHALVGTIEQVGLAVLISVPLGFLCAIFLNEIGGPLARPVRIFVDAMSGVPTIVAGFFVYAIWVIHFGFSGWAASLAISISMLPLITRTSEEVLRLVPDGLREASLALGTSEWRTTWGVVLPTARAGLITAVVLGVARAIGETAPLIMTAFGSSLMNANPFKGAQASLPLYVFKLLTESSTPNVRDRAYTGCLVLMMLVLVLFGIARFIGSRAGRMTQR
jgi:phosphate transport system permease protein